MSSQRSPRYPLRSHDFPMNPDLVASPRTSIQLRSRALEGSSQNTMPSIVNHTPNAVTDFHYTSKTYFENGSFGNSQNILDWQDLQDPSILLHDTHQNRTNLNHSAPHFNSPFGISTPEDVTDQSVWNYDDSHGPPAPPFSYSEYSDAFSVGSDADLKPVLQATTQPSTSSPYMNRSQHRQSHLAMTNYPQANRSVLSIPRQEYSSLYPESELYQNCLIAPRLQPSTPLKNESSATNSPSIINNYEYDSSTAVGFDDGSDAEGSVNAEPYAQLIYRALKSVPGHGMVLKEIYDWFEKNTDKARNTSSKGWQNSIRHNLSMNGVCIRYPFNFSTVFSNSKLGV